MSHFGAHSLFLILLLESFPALPFLMFHLRHKILGFLFEGVKTLILLLLDFPVLLVDETAVTVLAEASHVVAVRGEVEPVQFLAFFSTEDVTSVEHPLLTADSADSPYFRHVRGVAVTGHNVHDRKTH